MPETPGPGPERNDPHREVGTSWGHATSGESARDRSLQLGRSAKPPVPKEPESTPPPVRPELSEATQALVARQDAELESQRLEALRRSDEKTRRTSDGDLTDGERRYDEDPLSAEQSRPNDVL